MLRSLPAKGCRTCSTCTALATWTLVISLESFFHNTSLLEKVLRSFCPVEMEQWGGWLAALQFTTVENSTGLTSVGYFQFSGFSGIWEMTLKFITKHYWQMTIFPNHHFPSFSLLNCLWELWETPYVEISLCHILKY